MRVLVLLLSAHAVYRATAYLPERVTTLVSTTTRRTSLISKRHVVSEERQTQTRELDVKLLNQLENCGSGTAARRLLQRALPNEGALFGSVSIPPGASDRSISDGDLAIQTKIRNKKYGVFELIDLNGDRDADRASAGVLSVFLASSFSAIAANENMPGPEILRFCVVWVLSFTPLALVGYGIATPEKLQALLVSIQRELFPTYRKRMIQHEAGHFLLSHLLGYPIQGYSSNAVKNAVEFYPLSDPNAGRDRANLLGFDKPSKGVLDSARDFDMSSSTGDAAFFSQEGRGAEIVESQSVFRQSKNYTNNPFLKLPSQMEPTNSWPYRGFDHSTVDKLAVVSVAGVCAEILAFGNAEGGVADFSQLRQIFRSADPELTERDMENRIRFSVGFAMTQLRLHLGALDALAEVMERNGNVAECVAAIECCSNVSGNDSIFGDYDVRRRKNFRSIGVSLWEKFLLGEKNADTEETRLIEGKGGGYKKENKRLIQLSGDDPLYIALGIACLFLAYASSGGVTLK